MPTDYKFEHAINAVRKLKSFSLVFTDYDVRVVKPHNLKLMYRAIYYLEARGEIRKVYRVYSPDKPSQYVDFKRRAEIPYGNYAYYEPTGEEFYVSKYNLPEVFYLFS